MQVTQDILTPAQQAAEKLIERVQDADVSTEAVTNAASTAAAKVAEVASEAAAVANEAIAAGQAKFEDATSDSPNWLRNSIIVTVIAAALAFAAVRLQRHRAQRANAATSGSGANGPYR